MKLALFSDIHGNLQALDACLAHARAQGAEQVALLGDLVGYGANPAAVVHKAQQLAANGAFLVKGNHDALAVAPPAQVRTMGERTAAWTHAQLDAGQREFLDKLPLTARHGSTMMVHASLNNPAQWHYMKDRSAAADCLSAACEWPEVRHVFCGHVHVQALYKQDADTQLETMLPQPGTSWSTPSAHRWAATIGSVGQPRDGEPRAMYAIFDTQRLQLTFQRVVYNHRAAAEAIRRAGLGDFFAGRLALGR